MNKQETIQHIKNLFAGWLQGPDAQITQENIQEIDAILKNYLAQHTDDTDLWLRLALLHMNALWDTRDDAQNKSISYIQTILSHDPHNRDAVLVLAFIEHSSYGEQRPFGQISELTFQALCNLTTEDREVLAMIEFAKSFYYEKKDEEKWVLHFLKSIDYCDSLVNNYLVLGRYYLKKREFEKGKKLLQKALDNIQGIYDVDVVHTDITDIHEFFNYYYKGIHRTIGGGFMIGNVEKLQESLNKLK